MVQIIVNDGTAVAITGYGVNPNEIEVNLGTGNKENTKVLLLKFLRSELLYDIKNISFVTGDVMPEENQHTRHMVQDIGEEGNVDRVTRTMDIAVAECTELLYPLTKGNVEQTTTLDDKLTETATYEIKGLVPDDFSQSTAVLLERYIHEYIISRVLSDWLLIADPAGQVYQTWLAKCEATKASIEECTSRRTGRARKSQTPF